MSTLYTDRFTYDPKSKSLSAEVSELGGMQPINFRLRSQWTGHTIDVYLTTTERDREGDILAWNYTAPEVEDLKITVFND